MKQKVDQKPLEIIYIPSAEMAEDIQRELDQAFDLLFEEITRLSSKRVDERLTTKIKNEHDNKSKQN